jgi:hypothetical protein
MSYVPPKEIPIEYLKAIEHIKTALIEASHHSKAPEKLAPLMAVADLSISVLADMFDGSDESLFAAIELFQRRLENNIDAEVRRRHPGGKMQ